MFENTKAFSGFSVNDLQKAKQFYGKTLGLKVNEREEGLELEVGGGTKFLSILNRTIHRQRSQS
jgi:catechol-2,3-dioxygenase